MVDDNERISHENILWWIFRGLVEETEVPEFITEKVLNVIGTEAK